MTAAAISPWNMHSHVPKEVFPASGTMKFVISRPTSSQKYIMKYASNRTCSQPRQTNCLELPPTHRTGRGSTSWQTECGVGDLRRHFLMYESSIPRPHQQESDTRLLQKTREGKETSIRTEDTRSGAFVFHSTCLFGHMRNGERGNLFLPTSGFNARSEWNYSYSTTLCWLRCRLTQPYNPCEEQDLLNIMLSTPQQQSEQHYRLFIASAARF